MSDLVGEIPLFMFFALLAPVVIGLPVWFDTGSFQRGVRLAFVACALFVPLFVALSFSEVGLRLALVGGLGLLLLYGTGAFYYKLEPQSLEALSSDKWHRSARVIGAFFVAVGLVGFLL